MKIINRKYYIDKLIALKNKPDIKIITGVRRAGKSVLLNEFSKYILSVEKDANIIRINFNLLAFDELKDFKKLNSYIRRSARGLLHDRFHHPRADHSAHVPGRVRRRGGRLL